MTDPTLDVAEDAPVHADHAAALDEARRLAGPEAVLAAVEQTNYARAYADPHPIVEGE